MPELPLVSVVIPTYNRRELLGQAVASVLAQAYPRLEVVIGDDGSTDGTAEWVDSLGDRRVRLLSTPHTGHIGRVRNLAAGEGTGELIAFLDSDDVWLPGKLEAQVAAMRARGARWCYTGYELMDVDGWPLPFRSGGYKPISGRIVRELLTCEASAYIGTMVVERSLFESVGRFSEDARLAFRGDYELALRLALAADVLALPEVFTRVREHPGRSTGAISDPFERSAMAYELFLELAPPADLARIARRVCARHLADGAAHRLARGEYPAAARLLVRSFAADPAGPWLRTALSGVRRVLGRRAPASPLGSSEANAGEVGPRGATRGR